MTFVNCHPDFLKLLIIGANGRLAIPFFGVIQYLLIFLSKFIDSKEIGNNNTQVLSSVLQCKD